jgi:hypothetical protein
LQRGKPVPALLNAAQEADVLVVCSRGVTGRRSLGSVSERGAQHAPCSLLVVRVCDVHAASGLLTDESESFYACSFTLSATFSGTVPLTEIDTANAVQLLSRRSDRRP